MIVFAKLTSTFHDQSSLLNLHLRQEWHLTNKKKKENLEKY